MTASPRALDPATGRGPGLLVRLGLAVVRPRTALAIAGDRRQAGRSGSDLLVAMVVMLAATRLRALVLAGWLAAVVGWGAAGRAMIGLLTQAITIDLGFLVIAAALVWAAAGPRRELGRAFDLACVAILPLVFVEGIAQVAAVALGLPVGVVAVGVASALAYLWTILLVLLAILEVRRDGAAEMRPGARRAARIAAGVLAAVAAVGCLVPAIAILRAPDTVRPMTRGDRAPAFALPAVGPGGELGAPLALASTAGKVTVIDFWATWCGPCRASLPRLDALARQHPDVAVIAVNLDDPAAARAMFDRHHYTMTLVEDDGTTSERYGVTTIPHTVIVDRSGTVRHVVRGGGTDVEAAVEAMLR